MIIAIIHRKIPREFTKAQLTQICIFIQVFRATALLSRPRNHTLEFILRACLLYRRFSLQEAKRENRHDDADTLESIVGILQSKLPMENDGNKGWTYIVLYSSNNIPRYRPRLLTKAVQRGSPLWSSHWKVSSSVSCLLENQIFPDA